MGRYIQSTLIDDLKRKMVFVGAVGTRLETVAEGTDFPGYSRRPCFP